jgi:hypothetical protein
MSMPAVCARPLSVARSRLITRLDGFVAKYRGDAETAAVIAMPSMKSRRVIWRPTPSDAIFHGLVRGQSYEPRLSYHHAIRIAQGKHSRS